MQGLQEREIQQIIREKREGSASIAGLLVAICDDCAEDRNKYAEWLREIALENEVKVQFIFYQSGEEALFQMEDQKLAVDIIFLDIGMPGEDGMTVARKLRQTRSAAYFGGEIIFLTKSKEYAIEAFDVNAFHYIVKNQTSREKFAEIFLNAVARIRKKRGKQLLLRGIGEYRNIDIDSIRYLEVNRRIITVHYGEPEQTFEFYSTMDKLVEMLFPFRLLRIHRAYIAQVAYMEKLSYDKVILKDKSVLPVGRAYYAELRQLYEAMVTNSVS